jgi:hypothetical protein
MPVRKFRSIEAMKQPTWRSPVDPMLYAAIASVWERAARLLPRRFVPGVRRFRDIASLERDADADLTSASPPR